MVKLKDNGSTDVKEVGEEVSVEKFSIENYPDGTNQTVLGEELKQGMSYSPKMLDINELFENGVVQRGDKIDLINFPDIEIIQVATQEQLEMLTPQSKEQITAIHLSNNTPVGWDDDFDYSNRYSMDKEIDLTSFENVTEVQTHFYVNDELENIKLPEGVEEVLCRHSKMKNLSTKGDLQDVDVVLDRAETAFDFDRGMSGYDNEYEEPADEFYQLDNYRNVQEKDGSYTLYYQAAPVLKNLEKPAEVSMFPASTAHSTYEDERFNFGSEVLINDNVYVALQSENDGAPKFYLRERGDDLGCNCTKVTFSNSLDPDEKVNSLEIIQYQREGMGGSFDSALGLAQATLRRDIPRGYTPGALTMYTKHEGEYVGASDDYSDYPKLRNYINVYSLFLKKLDEKGIELSTEEREAKESLVFRKMKAENPNYLFDDYVHPRVKEMMREVKRQAQVKEWKQHRKDDSLKRVRGKLAVDNKADEAEKSHNQPAANVSILNFNNLDLDR